MLSYPTYTILIDNICLRVDHQTKNLINDGNFETGGITNWTSAQQGGGEITIYEAVAGSRAGICALKAVGDTENTYNSFLTLVQTLDATPDSEKEYTLSANVCADVASPSGKTAYIAIRERNSQGSTIVYRQAMVNLSATGWCGTYYKFVPNETAASFQAYVVISNFGNDDKLLVDNIKLTVEGSSQNLVKNANFEIGDLTNWSSPQQGGGTVTIHEVITDSQVGNYILEANGDPENTYNSFLTLTQVLTNITPDSEKCYLLYSHVCPVMTALANPYDDEDDRHAYLAIREVDSEGHSIIYRQAPIDLTRNDWNIASCEFTPTEDTVRFDAYVVICNFGDDDKILVDEITLVEDTESEYAFDPNASHSASSPIELNDGILQVIVDNQNGMINKIRVISEDVTLQPAADDGMQIFAETLFGKQLVVFQKKTGSSPVQNGNTITYQIEPADRKLLPLTGTVTYALADGVLTETVALTALDTIEVPVKIGIRHGFDASDWDNIFCGLRPTRVLNSEDATYFSYDERNEDINLTKLDSYQRVIYPITILGGEDVFWLIGSCNLDEFVTMAPNHPAGYFPSIQQNPMWLYAGQTLNFETSFKAFSTSSNLLRDVWKWYNQNIYTNDPLIEDYIPYQSSSYRTFFPGCFAGSTYFDEELEDELFAGSNIWWFGWHDWINESYPTSGEWWTPSNYWASKMTNTAMAAETASLQGDGFKLLYYFRQIANLRLKGTVYPESWYRTTAGGSLDMYEGSYEFGLPENVANDVGYATVPWGTYNFDNLEFRDFYIDQLLDVVDYYEPNAIGWDMGWSPSHRGMFRVQAEVFNLLRTQYPNMKIASNESAGPTQFYSDLVLLENGFLGGKVHADFELVKALNTTSAVIERLSMFELAVDCNLDNTSSWLSAAGLALNKKYLDYLLDQEPDLYNDRPEAARRCLLRMALYDLSLGSSPGYLEKAKPVPATLSTVAGEIMGIPLITESFKVKLASSGKDTDDEQAASVWLDSDSCRLVIFNDKVTTATSVQLKLAINSLTAAGWSTGDVPGGTGMIVDSADEEEATGLSITSDANDVIFTITLPPFSALIYSQDKS